MRALFVGLGSIGTRHLNNLHTVACRQGISLEIDALRSSSRELPAKTTNLLHAQYTSYTQVPDGYDIIFITNPTHLHFEALKALSAKGDTFFIEKPIFEMAGYSLEACGLNTKKAYVAAPMRWCRTYMQLKQHLQQVSCYSARVICSSYLPDWRPNTDYRKVYSAIKAMGGGVTIDLIHEWDYIVDLFGMPQETYNFKGTYSHLEIDSDDLSVYIARYPAMLAEIHLDYFGRTYRRTIELFTKDGTIEADFGKGILTLADGTCIDCNEEVNQRYLREMEYFLQYAHGPQKESVNSPALALQTLKLTLGE
ncbi:MAG: Gfo/Idh/MocA family oxidoreductase [Oscillospiraceae bacterium]|nr:Gfo/Idh/MocA family oxidoreductase [Oscillospiraceae bacterium]